VGSIRCAVGTPLTLWMPPTPLRGCYPGRNKASGGRCSNRVKVRTHGGSPVAVGKKEVRAQRATGSLPGCSNSGNLAPSAVYAPSNSGFALPQPRSSASVLDSAVRQFHSSRHLVILDFNPSSSCELKLVVNQYVRITYDTYEDGQPNTHRWVFGENEATNDFGYFPVTHVREEVDSQA